MKAVTLEQLTGEYQLKTLNIGIQRGSWTLFGYMSAVMFGTGDRKLKDLNEAISEDIAVVKEEVDGIFPGLKVQEMSFTLMNDIARSGWKSETPRPMDTSFRKAVEECRLFWERVEEDSAEIDIVIDSDNPKQDGSPFVALSTGYQFEYGPGPRPYFPKEVREAVKESVSAWLAENVEWLKPVGNITLRLDIRRGEGMPPFSPSEETRQKLAEKAEFRRKLDEQSAEFRRMLEQRRSELGDDQATEEK